MELDRGVLTISGGKCGGQGELGRWQRHSGEKNNRVRTDLSELSPKAQEVFAPGGRRGVRPSSRGGVGGAGRQRAGGEDQTLGLCKCVGTT